MARNSQENGFDSQMKLQDKIDSLVLDSRRVFLDGPVDSDSASDIIRKLWYLEIKDPGKPILMLINSPGGSVDSGFAIWDQVKMLSSPVTTLITGLAASMGSVLSLCAPPGKRFATPNSRIMIHQPMIGGVVQGQATDLEIQAREILKLRKELVKIYVEATKQSEEKIELAIDRDAWFSAAEAKEYGLINDVVSSYKEIGF